ncbi:MAG TPA: hypothetical protein PLP27_12640, partial [Crocinitomicaceae bacterium]|nr:hypothetical protein [Crocinitomicaceae bacterium]
RITAKDKKEWEDFANANLSLAETSIARLTAKETVPVNTGSNKPAPVADERKDWTFTDWSRKDTQGLLKMKAENPEAYRALAEKSGVKF